MTRTLLPVFNDFKDANGVNEKEEPETFQWMNQEIRGDYEKAKMALDNIEGSREWLKTYTFKEDSEAMPFCSGLGLSLLADFGGHHSGSSAAGLAWNYKAALNDWDTFVYEVKEYELRKLYKDEQLTKADIDTYSLDELKEVFKIPYDDDVIKGMISALKAEILADELALEKEDEAHRFAAKINILKHHYAFPDRWFDRPSGSSLFGSPEDIRGDMMLEMTKMYSDYPKHIEQVLDAYKAHHLWQNNRNDLTPSEAAELEARASSLRVRLFDPPDLKEGQHTQGDIDKISKSRASYLTRLKE
jgi:hypothetical protein